MNLNFPLAPTVPRTTTSSRPKMRRQREGMQVNVAGLRRNIMNLAHNYSGAQVKVREATSNDPWGPSSTLMSEIADLTYNVVAFTEIMQMVWKRLNDHGRNWRHVYKALVLLDYLIKTGSEKVAQQCKENIFAIQTLRDFQYVEEGKDQGINVREKAKQLVLLLKDDERLRNERARALKAKERFAQTASGFGSDTGLDTVSPSSPGFPSYRDAWGSCEDATPTGRSGGAGGAPELESARPQTVGEEELQLQLALAMSREEAQQEEQKRRSDDVRLQLALSQSENEFKQKHVPKDADMPSSHMLDLLDVNLGAASPPQPTLDPWGMPASQPPPPRPQTDPWSVTTASSTPSVSDPWTPASTSAQPLPPKPDPWRAVSSLPEPPTPVPPKPPMNDPWSPASPALSVSPPPPHSGANNGYSCAANAASTPLSDLDEFDQILNRDRNINSVNNNLTGTISPDPFDLSGLSNSLTPSPSNVPPPKKTPQSFLGENSSLVNLENLVTKTSLTSVPAVPAPPALANPFSNSPTLVRPPLRTPPYPPAVQAPLLPQPNPFLS